MMYWHAGPQYFCQYTAREEVPGTEWNLRHYDLLREIEEKYLNGFYKHQTILFNPRYDVSSGMEGHNWTQDYADKPRRTKLPVEMFEPSIPDVQWEEAGKPIKSAKRVNYGEILRLTDNRLSQLNDDNSNEDSA